MTSPEWNHGHFNHIKAKRLAKISTYLSVFLFLPMIQFIIKKNIEAIIFISLAQASLIYLSALLKSHGLFNRSALFISLLLATVLFYRSLQGGGIHAASTVWFVSVAATGLVFLKRQHIFVLFGYMFFACVYLFLVTMGGLPNPVTQVDEPIFNFFFDVIGNITVVAGLFFIHNDIFKEQMEIIREQENALMLQSRMQSMGEMAAGIAHEINNPLAIISSISETIKIAVRTESTDKNKMNYYTDRINKTVDRIASIVMSLKKLSHGGIDGDYENFYIENVLKEVETFTRSKASEANSTLSFINENKGLQFHGSFTLVGQVILNLIVNAIHATEELETRWVRVATEERAGLVTIRVTDSGLGIPEELSKKIFNPFFTTKEVGKGTGLGLSLCKTAVERMSGHLYVNHDSQNTEFVIELPMSRDSLSTIVKKSA